jgi:hypothetical protein
MRQSFSKSLLGALFLGLLASAGLAHADNYIYNYMCSYNNIFPDHVQPMSITVKVRSSNGDPVAKFYSEMTGANVQKFAFIGCSLMFSTPEPETNLQPLMQNEGGEKAYICPWSTTQQSTQDASVTNYRSVMVVHASARREAISRARSAVNLKIESLNLGSHGYFLFANPGEVNECTFANDQ